MPFVLAHAGHWLVWVLYAVPALIVLAATINSVLAQRREAKRDGEGTGG